MEPQIEQPPERPPRRIRRENLLRLAAECESMRDLADRTGTVASHLSAIKAGARDMGDELASKLEAGMGKPFGWMDSEPMEPPVEREQAAAPFATGADHRLATTDRRSEPRVEWQGAEQRRSALPHPEG